ncbi:MAG: hypothetical protein EBT86_10135 [Actinobacteria bacterium]|nr:hypothetical protein [Actinomycetota bacterium]
MKKLILSRGPSIDIQQCTKIVGGNKFELVLIAAQHNYTVESLLDLQDNKLDTAEMLNKRINHVNKPSKKVDNTRTKKVK